MQQSVDAASQEDTIQFNDPKLFRQQCYVDGAYGL